MCLFSLWFTSETLRQRDCTLYARGTRHISKFRRRFLRCVLCRYTIDRRTDMDRVFNIHAGNGSVYILRELDREENAWHNISVIATEFSECSRHFCTAAFGRWSRWLLFVEVKSTRTASIGWYLGFVAQSEEHSIIPNSQNTAGAFIWPGSYLKQVNIRQLLRLNFSSYSKRILSN